MALVDYTPRSLVRHLERDRDTPLRLGVYHAGAIVEPTSGTITIYDSSNAAVVSAAAVTIDGSDFANYTLPTATVAAKSYGSGWRIEWSMLMPDGHTHVYRFGTALVRVRHACPVTDLDLLSRRPDIAHYYPTGFTSWQTQIDAAWDDVQDWIEGKGKRAYLITSQDALRPWVRAHALSLVSAALAGDGAADNAWNKRADDYAAEAQRERDTLTLEYDESDTGQASPGRRSAMQPSVWLSRSPSRGRY